MKILSVFSNGNEIAIRNNMLGQEIILYNGTEMYRKATFFGGTHVFEVREGSESVEYLIKIGYNSWGLSMNVWRNGEPIVKGLGATYERCRPERRQNIPPPASTNSSYHHDLV